MEKEKEKEQNYPIFVNILVWYYSQNSEKMNRINNDKFEA